MACDPNTLLEQAKCITTCIPAGMMPAVNTALLCQIVDGGGGGTGPAGPAGPDGPAGAAGPAGLYIDRAPAAPDDPSLPALSYPSGGGTLFQWDVGSATWV